MKFLPLSALTKYKKSRTLSPLLNPKVPNPNFFSSVAAMLPLTDQSPSENPDELLCAALSIVCSISDPKPSPTSSLPTVKSFDLEQNVKRAWRFWNNLGAPKLVVAPMVDNSELPFRMLCRKYGAQAAYTPMLHSKNLLGNEKHRKMEFSTCQEDRPLFVQFCANDPDTLGAAKIVEPYCDYVDINFGRTMDRYQRVEKPKEEAPMNENEIRITAQGRMQNYITYALTLLQVKRTNGEEKQNKTTDEFLKRQGRVHNLNNQIRICKSVDEDLYKIPPEFLYKKQKKGRGLKKLWPGCLSLGCIA